MTIALLWGGVGLCLDGMRADAGCVAYPQSEVRALEELVGSDPARAMREIHRAVERANRSATPDRNYQAALYAVQAEASSALELDSAARDAASIGLNLLTPRSGPLYINLLYTRVSNSYDTQDIQAANNEVSEALRQHAGGTPEEACLLIMRGYLQHQADRNDQASETLTMAYRMSEGPGRERQRTLAADSLSTAARDLGAFQEALELNQEVIESDTRRKAWFDLSITRFMRGNILRLMGDHVAAIREYEDARMLSSQMNDPQGVALADLRICASKMNLGQMEAARSLCESALGVFTQSKSNQLRKDSLLLLARLDLAENHAARALARLNEVLDQNGADLLPRMLPDAFELRARTNAALSRYHEAFDDATSYIERYKASNETERARVSAELRARFDTDRALERSAALKREVEIQNERLRIQSERLNGTIALAIGGVIAIALLTYLLIANRKQRRQLVQLAEMDSLTGLPNRRSTFEHASQVLKRADEESTDVTIAVIDLDFFKSINDRFGHATGDYVLQAFASAARRVLREADFIGRWGGEEFLVVLPQTSLDTAMSVMERLRAAALEIKGDPEIPGLKVSLSAGLATNETEAMSLDDIVALADTALYEAKNSGRDVVRISEESYRLATTAVRRALHASGVSMSSTGGFERPERKPGKPAG